jgi:hypothetical protein
MPGPFDYSIKQPDIGGSLLGGIQAGRELAAQSNARDQAQQYATDLQGYLQSPSASGAAALTAKYPEQREAFKQSWELLNKDQQDEQFRSGVQAYSAIQNGLPDVAKSIVDKQIAAMENSGQDPSAYKSIRDAIDRNPQGVGAQIGLTLSALEPDKWGKIAGEMRESAMAPSELTESQAKASKAATDAKFAESKAVQDLEKSGWEINKLANDIGISKLNSQIAAMNAATARQGNDLKGQSNNLKFQELQLKIQDKIAERDAKVGEKVSSVQSGRAAIDNFLNTADKAINTPASVIESAAGTVSSVLPTYDQDVADFEETIKTLGSQAFLSQVPAMKGLGALTEAEGKKLESSLANLSLRQSPKKITENLKEAQRLMLKARATLSERYGVPDVTPDTPAAQPSPTNIEALLQKYGGAQ